MGSPLRKRLVSCLNAKTVTSVEFILVAKVGFVGPGSLEGHFLLDAIPESSHAALVVIMVLSTL